MPALIDSSRGWWLRTKPTGQGKRLLAGWTLDILEGILIAFQAA
jgi:hypothetical protein